MIGKKLIAINKNIAGRFPLQFPLCKDLYDQAKADLKVEEDKERMNKQLLKTKFTVPVSNHKIQSSRYFVSQAVNLRERLQ